jgi:hypothetical protein
MAPVKAGVTPVLDCPRCDPDRRGRQNFVERAHYLLTTI